MKISALIMGAAILLCTAACGPATKGSSIYEPLGMPEEMGEPSSPAGVIGEGGAQPSAPKRSSDRNSPADTSDPTSDTGVKDPPTNGGADPFSGYDCGGATNDVCLQAICQVQASFEAARSSCGERCGQLETCAAAFVECYATYCQDNEIIDAQKLSGCGTTYQSCMTL